MSAPRVTANWYDGRSALRHTGTAEWDGDAGLVLHGADGVAVTVPLAALQFQETRPDALSYRLAGDPDFRLLLPRDVPAELATRLPARHEYGKWVDRFGLGKAAAAFAVVSAAVIVLFFTAPGWLGPIVPESWERSMGEAMVGDLGNRVCHTPAGDAALTGLARRLDPTGAPVRVGVANIPLINAAALPGGQVLIFDGLIQQADSPDELAGVLAHEIGHVRKRHVMTSILRQFGLSILVSGMSSGLGGDALGLISLDYSRDAESEADAYARERLAAADISPASTAGFFERLGGKDTDVPQWASWVDSHPSPSGRARAFRQSVHAGHAYRPALSASEFTALQAMCESDPDVETFGLFD